MPCYPPGTPEEYGLAFVRNLGRGENGGPNRAAATLEADPAQAARFGAALLHARMASPQAMAKAAATLAAAKIPVLVITGGWSPFFDGVGARTAELTGGAPSNRHGPGSFPADDRGGGSQRGGR